MHPDSDHRNAGAGPGADHNLVPTANDAEKPSAEARIPTARADRYVTQLCDHLDHMGRDSSTRQAQPGRRHRQPGIRHVERTGRLGHLTFDWGSCTLQASDDVLTVRVQADDDHALARALDLIGHRIATIGRREHLTVNWRRTHLGDA